jgi:hypothetical protein
LGGGSSQHIRGGGGGSGSGICPYLCCPMVPLWRCCTCICGGEVCKTTGVRRYVDEAESTAGCTHYLSKQAPRHRVTYSCRTKGHRVTMPVPRGRKSLHGQTHRAHHIMCMAPGGPTPPYNHHAHICFSQRGAACVSQRARHGAPCTVRSHLPTMLSSTLLLPLLCDPTTTIWGRSSGATPTALKTS